MANSDNLFKKIRDASKKILSTFLGKTSKNNIDGREVKFTKRSLEKMTSGSAVGKSLDNGFTREDHYEAAQNILEIFKTAKFLQTEKPKNGSLDILGVHKYMGEYKNANVKITIKEIKENGNRFYSIELLELLSRDMQSGDPKTGNLDNTAIIHTGEEPPRPRTSSPYNANTETIPNQSIKEAETTAKTAEPTPKPQEPLATTAQTSKTQETQAKAEPNTNSRLEKIKKFIQGKTNKALDSEIKTYNELYRYVLDDFAKAHPDELNLPKYASEMANYITKEFLVKHDKEIKEIINKKTSGENRQIALNAFENLKQNFDELRSVGIGDLRKPTAKDIKDKIA